MKLVTKQEKKTHTKRYPIFPVKTKWRILPRKIGKIINH